MLREYNVGIEKDKKIRTRKREDFHLANIDLELECLNDLKPLIKELETDDRAYSMNLHLFEENEPVTSVTFEIGNYPNNYEQWIYQDYNDADDLIGGVDKLLTAFCDLIENLSNESKAIWNQCTKREFDIGFECGNTEKSFKTVIRPETVKRCAEIAASIMITVYPHINYVLKDI